MNPYEAPDAPDPEQRERPISGVACLIAVPVGVAVMLGVISGFIAVFGIPHLNLAVGGVAMVLGCFVQVKFQRWIDSRFFR